METTSASWPELLTVDDLLPEAVPLEASSYAHLSRAGRELPVVFRY